jgi:hypothetical protein
MGVCCIIIYRLRGIATILLYDKIWNVTYLFITSISVTGHKEFGLWLLYEEG